ncbi:MAG: hypothetical protein NT048_04520 [Flavobacterium sp.]|nr:hypothetical protein [Flavobacterium sp.]
MINSVIVTKLSCKKILRYHLVALALISNEIIYSQGPNDNDAGGGLFGDEAPVAAIDSQLNILILLGLIIAFYAIKGKLNNVNR